MVNESDGGEFNLISHMDVLHFSFHFIHTLYTYTMVSIEVLGAQPAPQVTASNPLRRPHIIQEIGLDLNVLPRREQDQGTSIRQTISALTMYNLGTRATRA